MIDNMLSYITDYLIDNVAILIYPKSEEESREIRKEIRNLQLPIVYSCLSTEDKNILLLRYFSHVEKYDDYLKNNLSILNNNCEKKKYKKAIEAGLNLLQVGSPNVTGYMKVAILYLKLKEFDNALKYLEIAYYIDKRNGHNIEKMEQMINRIKKASDVCFNPELIEYYDSLLSSINDYIIANNKSVQINIKKEEFDLLKFFIRYYKNLTFTKNENVDNHCIRIKSKTKE